MDYHNIFVKPRLLHHQARVLGGPKQKEGSCAQKRPHHLHTVPPRRGDWHALAPLVFLTILTPNTRLAASPLSPVAASASSLAALDLFAALDGAPPSHPPTYIKTATPPISRREDRTGQTKRREVSCTCFCWVICRV